MKFFFLVVNLMDFVYFGLFFRVVCCNFNSGFFDEGTMQKSFCPKIDLYCVVKLYGAIVWWIGNFSQKLAYRYFFVLCM